MTAPDRQSRAVRDDGEACTECVKPSAIDNKTASAAVRRKEGPVTEVSSSDRGIHLSGTAVEPKEGTVNMLRRTRSHRHHEVTTHVIRQRAGVPYQVEQRVCSECRTIIAERQLRRAAA